MTADGQIVLGAAWRLALVVLAIAAAAMSAQIRAWLGRRKGPGRTLWRRIGTVAVLLPVLLGIAWAGPLAFSAMVAGLTVLALAEFRGLLDKTGVAPLLVPYWLFGLLPVTAGAFWGMSVALQTAALAVVGVPLLALLGRAPMDSHLPGRLGVTVFGALYVGLLLAFAPAILAGEGGLGRLIWVSAVVQCADSFAYLGGRILGRRRLAPRVSPNKTWEGLAVGLTAGMAGGWAFAFALPGWSLGGMTGFALALGIAGLFGDLCASQLKRATGLSDYSAVLPGHGGILDRFDSSLFALPLAWMVFVMGWTL